MSVRAKFSVTRYETSLHSEAAKNEDGSFKMIDGRHAYIQKEMRTIIMHPVYSDKPNSENKMFWDSSPSGELKLGTVNPAAWEQFELGKTYYLDFTPAPEE